MSRPLWTDADALSGLSRDSESDSDEDTGATDAAWATRSSDWDAVPDELARLEHTEGVETHPVAMNGTRRHVPIWGTGKGHGQGRTESPAWQPAQRQPSSPDHAAHIRAPHPKAAVSDPASLCASVSPCSDADVLAPLSAVDSVLRLRAAVSSLSVSLRKQEHLASHWQAEADAARAEAAASQQEAEAQAARARAGEEESAWLRLAADELGSHAASRAGAQLGAASAEAAADSTEAAGGSAAERRGWASVSPGWDADESRDGRENTAGVVRLGEGPQPRAPGPRSEAQAQGGVSAVLAELRGRAVGEAQAQAAAAHARMVEAREAAEAVRLAAGESVARARAEAAALRAELGRVNAELAREGVLVGARLAEAARVRGKAEREREGAEARAGTALGGRVRAEASLQGAQRAAEQAREEAARAQGAAVAAQERLQLAEDAVDALHARVAEAEADAQRWRDAASLMEERLAVLTGARPSGKAPLSSPAAGSARAGAVPPPAAHERARPAGVEIERAAAVVSNLRRALRQALTDAQVAREEADLATAATKSARAELARLERSREAERRAARDRPRTWSAEGGREAEQRVLPGAPPRPPHSHAGTHTEPALRGGVDAACETELRGTDVLSAAEAAAAVQAATARERAAAAAQTADALHEAALQAERAQAAAQGRLATQARAEREQLLDSERSCRLARRVPSLAALLLAVQPVDHAADWSVAVRAVDVAVASSLRVQASSQTGAIRPAAARSIRDAGAPAVSDKPWAIAHRVVTEAVATETAAAAATATTTPPAAATAETPFSRPSAATQTTEKLYTAAAVTTAVRRALAPGGGAREALVRARTELAASRRAMAQFDSVHSTPGSLARIDACRLLRGPASSPARSAGAGVSRPSPGESRAPAEHFRSTAAHDHRHELQRRQQLPPPPPPPPPLAVARRQRGGRVPESRSDRNAPPVALGGPAEGAVFSRATPRPDQYPPHRLTRSAGRPDGRASDASARHFARIVREAPRTRRAQSVARTRPSAAKLPAPTDPADVVPQLLVSPSPALALTTLPPSSSSLARFLSQTSAEAEAVEQQVLDGSQRLALALPWWGSASGVARMPAIPAAAMSMPEWQPLRRAGRRGQQ